MTPVPNPVAVRSKAWDCGPSLLGLRVRMLRGHDNLSVVSVVCCQVEVSATGRLLLQRISTERFVSECDHELLTVRSSWPKGDCYAIVKQNKSTE